jgi:hypothetical protein
VVEKQPMGAGCDAGCNLGDAGDVAEHAGFGGSTAEVREAGSVLEVPEMGRGSLGPGNVGKRANMLGGDDFGRVSRRSDDRILGAHHDAWLKLGVPESSRRPVYSA